MEVNSIVKRLTFSDIPGMPEKYKVVGTKDKPYVSQTGITVEAENDYIIVPIDENLKFREFINVNKNEIALAD